MSAPSSTRMVVLKARPGKGDPLPEHFAVETRDLPELGADQLAVHNIVMNVDPSMRGRLDEGQEQLARALELKEELFGPASAEACATRAPYVNALIRLRRLQELGDLAERHREYAIEAHGGEAAASRTNFLTLPAADQDALIAFLETR